MRFVVTGGAGFIGSHIVKLLLEKKYEVIYKACLYSILSSIKNDLSNFGIEFDTWYSESTLFKNDLCCTFIILNHTTRMSITSMLIKF